MFGKHFELNEETLHVVGQIGDHMPGGFFIYRAEGEGELLYANRVVIDIFGCADLDAFKELTGYTFKGMLHPDDYDAVEASIDEQIDARQDNLDYVEYRIVRADGTVRWVNDYGHFVQTEAYGGVYYVFISDITEMRSSLHEDLAVRQAVIEALGKAYHTMWLITDVEAETFSLYRGETSGQSAHAAPNSDALQHMKYSQAKESYIASMVAPSDQARLQEELKLSTIVGRLADKSQHNVTYLRRMPDGSERYFRIEFTKMDMPNAKMGVVCGFKDVDDDVREEQRIKEALSDALATAQQASKAKTAFLSSMSHEIRTPMNAIIGLNNIAMNDEETSPKAKEYLEKIGASANHLLTIINDILDMSRIESGRMAIKHEEFSFSKMLEQVNTIISGQCHDKGLHYECRVKGHVRDYYIGDDMKLRQVLINILGNAVKFTPSGGDVSLSIEQTARLDDKNTLRFVISDTGIGMSAEYLPRLFDAFSQEDSSATNQYGSTGLGMPITKNLVELMNGHIEVQSEKGAGTTFSVTVTLTESERDASEVPEGEMHPHEMTVLVIDDDEIACEHARVVLGQVGITCETAESGEAGLEMVKVRNARRDPYDLILVDWKMPGMDGVETTRQIRAVAGHDSAIVILTSYNWDDIAEEARDAGVDSFVSKPLFAGSVLDEFREAFKKKNAALAQAGRAELEGRRVLLAEDMAVNAEIIVMVLSMREVKVDVAQNGRVAVEMFSASPEGFYDAILMDMRMPVLDGLGATREIRALDRADAAQVPIIALTANAFDEDVQRSMQAGLDAHLSKPVEAETLFETLESLIRD